MASQLHILRVYVPSLFYLDEILYLQIYVQNYVSLAQNKYKLFERIALTKSQVHDFGLEYLRNPDPVVMMKLKKDPNAKQFRRENNGELFQIEVDAMQKDPERFKQLVLSSVDKYYDNETFKRVMQEYTPKYRRHNKNENKMSRKRQR
jgi:hypothetical protein